MSKTLKVFLLSALFILSFALSQNSDYNNGDIGIYVGSYGDLEFTNGKDSTLIDRVSILVAGTTNQVFDHKQDIDVEEEWAELETPTLGAYESSIVLNNAYSGNPPDVTVFENNFMWESGGYALVRFQVKNNESATLPARLGIEVIPQMNYNGGSGEEYKENVVNYFTDSKIVAFTTFNSTETIGFKFLNIDLARVQGLNDYDDYGPTDDQLYTLMTTPGFAVPDTAAGSDPTLVTILSSGTQNISPGGFKTLYIGIAIGSDSASMVDNMTALEDTAYLNVTSENSGFIPEAFQLAQNYPNPFNPVTTIGFHLAKEEHVELGVYNILGDQIAILKNGKMSKGPHSITFDAANIPSGIYFYTLKTRSASVTKKMILLK